MNTKFSSEHKIGDIVTIFPGASDIFYNYNVDFCCGGNRPLKEAIVAQNLDEQKLLNDLNQAYEAFDVKNNEFVDWAKETPGKLADYTVNKHHAYLNEVLPMLGDYTLKILKVHGKNHGELYKVHKLFNNLRSELEQHLVKEENLVFPLIKEYEKDKSPETKKRMIEMIDELEAEHTAAGDILKELREVTDHYALPADACKTFEMTYQKLKELEGDLFQHIHLENNILFPTLKAE